jgi:benzoyl-CoA reductase subunit B
MTERLATVERVRAVQRDWIAKTRESVAAGGPFAICNGDEAEEIFLTMGIPVLAINYWNFLILTKGDAPHFSEVLNARGYPGRHFYGLGLASSIAPEKAPWGGLPQPTIIVGSTRSEMELRVTELWARETGAHFFPMEFSFPSEYFEPLPDDWWNWTRDRWPELVHPARLDYRVDQERELIAFVEKATGRRFDMDELAANLVRVDEQIDHWIAAREIIAKCPVCPVTIRDQLSMYQVMWHRGTPLGVDLLKGYRHELEARASAGIAGYANERIRIHFAGETPPWGAWAEEQFGVVTVSNFYSGVPDLYPRTIYDNDPLRALAGRHLFLFAMDVNFMVQQARDHCCDAVVCIEPFLDDYPPEASRERQRVEAAGMRYLALPHNRDGEDIRARLTGFFSDFS